jgi:hypothetical protein
MLELKPRHLDAGIYRTQFGRDIISDHVPEIFSDLYNPLSGMLDNIVESGSHSVIIFQIRG